MASAMPFEWPLMVRDEGAARLPVLTAFALYYL